jgi:hypothetical protein
MKDLVVHTESWEIDYATADAKLWLPTESSMFSTKWINQLDWANQVVQVDLTKSALEPASIRSEVPPITGEPLSAQPFRTA